MIMADPAELVAIGKIVKPFGVKGEVRVLSLSDVPGRFQHLDSVTLVAPSGHAVMTKVNRVREDRGGYVVGVEALSTPEEAAAFRGGLIKISQDQVPVLPAGQYYEYDLIGMAVQDVTGRALGILEDVLDTGSHSIFAVRQNGREVLIPATRDAVASVDVEARIMTVRSATGLFDDAL